ncbi:LysR family transcriptional regulator [Chitinilyticum litopenaei]|uniref:LysR family transcriptional regulator n=1 Tax=Chitinilyticum litopenaei TaxID=1121276 RepID=UPI0003FA69EE|nr:LysR family transcriptional regulator [Chitinilyticum litopenaei]
MEIYQLKTLVAVAREGSITRAAEQLFLSQPAISAHIKALEDELGLTLFVRTPRGMALTGSGVQLLTHAERLLAGHRELLTEAARIKQQAGGTLRLGASRSPDAQWLGRLLVRLAEDYPEIDVQLQQGSPDEIERGLQDGTLDAGLYSVLDELPERFATLELGRYALQLAAPPGWVDAGQPLDWQQLAALPWIHQANSACSEQAIARLFARHGIRPAKLFHVEQHSATRTLIAGGVGLGLLHEPAAQEAAARGEVVLLGPAGLDVLLCFACLPARQDEPLLATVADLLRELQGG